MKTGNTGLLGEHAPLGRAASMEPGHEDREYVGSTRQGATVCKPQWSPVMKTGNTTCPDTVAYGQTKPQWSPVMKTGNTRGHPRRRRRHAASMEPGHEDREYLRRLHAREQARRASMEPGHEDREYAHPRRRTPDHRPASMEPGHEDREYWPISVRAARRVWPQWSPVMKTGNTRAARSVGADP